MTVQQRIKQLERQLALVQATMTDIGDDLLTVDDVQGITRLSKSAIYQKTCSRNGSPPELGHFKQGKRLYFRRSDIIAYLTRFRVPNRAEIEEQADHYIEHGRKQFARRQRTAV